MMGNQSQNALGKVGRALLGAAYQQAHMANKPVEPQLDNRTYRVLLGKARQTLAEADPTENRHMFLALKTALEELEASERGDSSLGGIPIFKSLVESILGGQREIDFGGRPRQGQKVSTNKAYLRTVAVALWECFPEKRDQLVSEARALIDIGTKKKLRKIVENFHQRHDVDIANSKSPLSIHMPVVKDLIENHGYLKLRDFV